MRERKQRRRGPPSLWRFHSMSPDLSEERQRPSRGSSHANVEVWSFQGSGNFMDEIPERILLLLFIKSPLDFVVPK